MASPSLRARWMGYLVEPIFLRWLACTAARIFSSSVAAKRSLKGKCFISGAFTVARACFSPEKEYHNLIRRNTLRWFGHVERMDSESLTGRVYVSEVDGDRGRGRPRLRWRDGMER